MSKINNSFEFYNPVLRDIKRQQEYLRNMIQPFRVMQQSISDMTTSAMQPYIDQQNYLQKQMASITKINNKFSDILRLNDSVSKLDISSSFFKIDSSLLKTLNINSSLFNLSNNSNWATSAFKTNIFNELHSSLPSVIKISGFDIKIDEDCSESIAKVTENIKHLGFLDFGINNDYFECDENSFPSYTEILESISTTTSDVYESIEHNEDVETEEVEPDVIKKFKQDIKMIDSCNEIQSVLYYFDKAYFIVDNLPYGFKLELYEKFQTFIIDVFYTGMIALTIQLIKWFLKYLLRDNQKLLDFFKK